MSAGVLRSFSFTCGKKKRESKAEQWLERLADDEHWLVREDAHNVWGRLLGRHFKKIKPILQGWTGSPSANLRRCVVIAVRKAGNLKKDDLAELLISLLEPPSPGQDTVR
jgi:hypothetical protein